MKPQLSIIVFVMLMGSSLLGSIGSYRATKQEVLDNLNAGLQQAIAKNSGTWLAQDTIRNYQQMQGTMSAPLAINMRDNTVCACMSEALRNKTFVEIQLIDHHQDENLADNAYLCSDTVYWTDQQQHASIAIRSVAQCSMATIFAMSDQRLPAALCLLAMLWGAFTMRRKHAPKVETATLVATHSIGGIRLQGESFYDADHQEIHLTPMQRRLLTMFFCAPDHKLSQSDICDSLWPKKDDASETLYALITRTKKVVESRYGVRIELDRGRGYSLLPCE